MLPFLSRKKLKKLINPPILQYPDFDKPFILTCNASKYSCVAVLSQMHGLDDLPVSFTSRNFMKGESNNPAIEQKLLAILFGLKYFKPFLAGRKFVVRSDHKPDRGTDFVHVMLMLNLK